MLTGLGALGLSGCTGDDPKATKTTSTTRASAPPTTSVAPAERKIVWETWPEYIDVDDKTKARPTLDAFVKDSGIPVTYKEDIQDNEEFVAKVKAKLDAKAPVGADVLTLTTWMAAKLRAAGALRPFGPVKSADKVISALARPDWDPDQSYAMPWQAGLTGIAYDARRVERAIGSVEELFTRADLKGRVGVLSEFNDTIGFGLLSQGGQVPQTTADQVSATIDYLTGRVSDGFIAGFYGNEYIDALTSGKIAAAMAWSGDVLQAQADNPYLKFVLPEEGLMIWADNLVMPMGSVQTEAVGLLADYYYQPEVAAKVAAWVNYICPVEGARAAMERIDPDLAANPLIFPDQSVLARSYQLPTLPAADETRLRQAFAAVAARKAG